MPNPSTNTHPSLALVTKRQSGLMPGVLAKVIPEFMNRGWTIYGDASISEAWAKANLSLDKLEAPIPETTTLGLVLGGDGTMLKAARKVGFSGTPLLGINLGFLGFLTAHPADQAVESVRKYFAGQLIQDNRRTLHVSVRRENMKLISHEVLNDAVITNGAISRILNLEIRIDGNLAAYLRADGLIAATPTGSTAYALSAGGPILHPTLDAWILAPICPHSLSMRPSVIPSHMTITVLPSNAEEARLTLDGRVGRLIQPGDSIHMYDAGGCVTLLKDPDVPFFDLLREKMHWNKE